jgi:hypothetical protein
MLTAEDTPVELRGNATHSRQQYLAGRNVQSEAPTKTVDVLPNRPAKRVTAYGKDPIAAKRPN